MKFTTFALLLFSISFSLFSCSGTEDLESEGESSDSDVEIIASCEVTDGKFCRDYTGEGWTETSSESDCDDLLNSSFSTEDCTTEDRIGSCEVNDGESDEYFTRFYEGNTETESELEESCGSSYWTAD